MKKEIQHIAILGHGASGLSAAIATKLHDMGVEIQTISGEEMTTLRQEYIRPESTPIIGLEPPPVFDMPFQPPLTRKQRRFSQRKNKSNNPHENPNNSTTGWYGNGL